MALFEDDRHILVKLAAGRPSPPWWIWLALSFVFGAWLVAASNAPLELSTIAVLLVLFPTMITVVLRQETRGALAAIAREVQRLEQAGDT